MFDLESPFVLASDVVVLAAKDMSERARRRVGCDIEDYVLSRRRSRARSKALNPDGFDLVQQFQTPRTLISAIQHLAKIRQKSPEVILDQCFPVIAALVNDDFLVHSERREQSSRNPTLTEGTKVSGFVIGECIQMFEDTELYRVRREDGQKGAMKVAREKSETLASRLEREALLHRHLDGRVNPALLAQGHLEDRAFIVVDWCEGRDVAAAADIMRKAAVGSGTAILALCIKILDAFAHLHDQGLIHGDVHPRNVYVDDHGSVTVLDYGLARLLRGSDTLTAGGRGGVGFFFDPQFAAAKLDGVKPPPADELSEQYSLAGLLHLILAGHHYLDFSFDEHAAFQQICSSPPRSFASLDLDPWPEVESILTVALNKSPDLRFSSVAEFSAQLRGVYESQFSEADESSGANRKGRRLGASSSSLDTLVADIVSEIKLGPRLSRTGIPGASNCSVHSGASGVAYALYRIACIRSDPTLLADADVWSTHAVRRSDAADAYFDPALDVTEETVGVASLTHSAVGTAYVHALITLASGSFVVAQQAIDLFTTLSSERDCPNLDLFAGRSGQLVGCAVLVQAAEYARAYVDLRRLEKLGNDRAQALWTELTEHPPIAACTALDNLGAAHGWSGILHALMRWAEAMKNPVPDGLGVRLAELSACAIAEKHGVRWPIGLRPAADYGNQNHMPGWCNGAAGHVHTWLLAATLLREEMFLDLAAQTGSQAFADSFPKSPPILCCGMTGVAYAMLALHRMTGELEWLTRARHLSESAVAEIRSPWLPRLSLFRGALGLAVLAADLEHPHDATMPIFGREN